MDLFASHRSGPQGATHSPKRKVVESVSSNFIMSSRPLLIARSLILIPCLLSSTIPTKPPRDAFSSQGLPSISPNFLSAIAASPSLNFTFPCLSLTYFQSWQMKRIKSRRRWGQQREVVGVGEPDIELIRLEKHAGLDTLLMSTTKDSSCVSGGSWRMLRIIQQGEMFKYACTHLCAKLWKVKERLPWDFPVPSLYLWKLKVY